jgi:hypothetical protein
MAASMAERVRQSVTSLIAVPYAEEPWRCATATKR